MKLFATGNQYEAAMAMDVFLEVKIQIECDFHVISPLPFQ